MHISDHNIHLAAFNWLEEKTTTIGDVLPRPLLEEGFMYQNQKITLLGAKGIWKPKVMELPLSITTISDGPYDDSFSEDGLR